MRVAAEPRTPRHPSLNIATLLGLYTPDADGRKQRRKEGRKSPAEDPPRDRWSPLPMAPNTTRKSISVPIPWKEPTPRTTTKRKETNKSSGFLPIQKLTLPMDVVIRQLFKKMMAREEIRRTSSTWSSQPDESNDKKQNYLIKVASKRTKGL